MTTVGEGGGVESGSRRMERAWKLGEKAVNVILI